MSDIHEMTDHAWVREYAAAYVADGLSIDEAMRLEAARARLRAVRRCAWRRPAGSIAGSTPSSHRSARGRTSKIARS